MPIQRPAWAPRYQQRYGPWAVITGASSGLGREMAVLLARAGLSLVLVARREGLLLQLAGALSRQHGVEVRTLVADLSTVEGMQRVALETAALDVGLLVAAAGFGSSGSFLTADLAAEAEMLRVNCEAVLRQAQVFAQRFAQRGRGGLVLMGSLAGCQGTPFSASYAASKAYVHTLAEGLHAELRAQGVDVVVSMPGPVHTEFAARAGLRMGMALLPADVASATLAALGRQGRVFPGWLSKLLGLGLGLLPRGWRVRAMGFFMRRMVA